MRVMILEDDLWIADLLKQIVLSLRPGAEVSCLDQVTEALADWQQHGADLVISDWNLPDGPGTRLLERVRRDDHELPLVMITGRADRASVMQVRALGIKAFISKPFQMSHVAASLDKLLPPVHERPGSSTGACKEDLLAHLATLSPAQLDLPLSQAVRDRLLDSFKGAPLDLRQLAEDWRHDPALGARLIAAANSSAYSGGARPCTSLLEALQRLGATTSLNLATGLALRQTSSLENAQLRTLAEAHLDASERLAERSVQLARQCDLNPAPLHSAALLHRMGELCVLYQVQEWADRGQRPDTSQISQAIARFSGPFAVAIKARWQLPMALRELIGACYGLPNTSIKRELAIMFLAASELAATPDQALLARLRRLAGLS